MRFTLFFTILIVSFSSLSWPVLARNRTPSIPLDPLISSSTTMTAQLDFTSSFTIYIPLINNAKPTNSMSRLVLQIDEVPDGFILFENSVITDFSKIAHLSPIEGYQVLFLDFKQIFAGPTVIINIAILFENENGAHGYLEFVKQNITNDPFTEIQAPPFGDESFAFQSITQDGESSSFVMNTIAFRENRIVIGVVAGGLFPISSDPSLVISLAQILADKFKNFVE